MTRNEIIRDLSERSAGAGAGQYMSLRCDVAREIVRMLREQEPRVMTLEEARKAIRDGGEDVIFWEEKMSLNPHRLSIGLRNLEEFTFADGDYAEFDVLDDPEVALSYGSLLRLWTSPPSPDQMRNTKWEGAENADMR